MDIAIRSLIATILFFLSHTNLRSLNQVFHCLRTKNLRCRHTLKTMAPQGFNSNNYENETKKIFCKMVHIFLHVQLDEQYRDFSNVIKCYNLLLTILYQQFYKKELNVIR